MADEGKNTSEFAAASQGASMSNVAAIAAMIVSVGGAVGDVTGHNVTAVVIVCASVALALITRDTIVKVAYIHSRAKVNADAASKRSKD